MEMEKKPLALNAICYASNSNGQLFDVLPIERGEALVTLTPIDENEDATGVSFRVLTGDFIEDFATYDADHKKIADALGEEE